MCWPHFCVSVPAGLEEPFHALLPFGQARAPSTAMKISLKMRCRSGGGIFIRSSVGARHTECHWICSTYALCAVETHFCTAERRALLQCMKPLKKCATKDFLSWKPARPSPMARLSTLSPTSSSTAGQSVWSTSSMPIPKGTSNHFWTRTPSCNRAAASIGSSPLALDLSRKLVFLFQISCAAAPHLMGLPWVLVVPFFRRCRSGPHSLFLTGFFSGPFSIVFLISLHLSFSCLSLIAYSLVHGFILLFSFSVHRGWCGSRCGSRTHASHPRCSFLIHVTWRPAMSLNLMFDLQV